MNVYEIITERIIERLEAGVVPWRRPWSSPGHAGMPRNLVSDKPYRGVNVLLLAMQGYASPYWLTFRQAKARGGWVRKGERGTPVVFWKMRQVEDDERDGQREVPILRYYRLFNVEQCVDVVEPGAEDAAREADMSAEIGCERARIARCEALVQAMPDAPEVRIRVGNAYYEPGADRVTLPPPWHFESNEAFYATLFHELVHSTGHERRVGRPAVIERARFASHAYSKEELVAEMGAAFLCGHTGIDAAVIDNMAAYVGAWIEVLRGEPKLAVQAGAAGQKAADFILGHASAAVGDAPSKAA
jgi:antirestriction protein ArdC